MYFYELIKKLSPVPESTVKDVNYQFTSVEIDNPILDCKISVPCFSIVEDKRPDYLDLNADSFSLQTLLDAGVNLKNCTVVSTSFLRETEKFVDSLKNAKI